MFSLIISIIAIALVAALALASIYYGGSAFQKGTDSATASTVVNQGQQIQGAVALAVVEQDTTWDGTSLNTLVGSYLKEVPEGWNDVNAGVITVSVKNATICEEINQKGAGVAMETSVANHAALTEDGTFGCFATGTDSGFTAYYSI